jgi:hypothetical protein
MKFIRFVVLICLLFVLTVPAKAAEITGKWVAPNNGVDVEFEFKVKGDKLKGKVDNPMFGKASIKDGKIEGGNFSFYIIHPSNNPYDEKRVFFKGVISGEALRITFRTAGRGLREIVATRKSPDK